MSEAGRKPWWRAAAVAVLGCGAVVGGWAALSRHATAEPSAPLVVAAPLNDEPTPYARQIRSPSLRVR